VNRVVLLDDAKIEWKNSVVWYEEQSIGLGSRFFEVVEKKLDLIAQSPEQFPKGKNNLREAVIRIFPFSIIFEYHKKDEIVVVVAIFHNKRNPKKKYKSRKS
jgi:plasmid stabilization system protein ParE